jgi:hypothetical protein
MVNGTDGDPVVTTGRPGPEWNEVWPVRPGKVPGQPLLGGNGNPGRSWLHDRSLLRGASLRQRNVVISTRAQARGVLARTVPSRRPGGRATQVEGASMLMSQWCRYLRRRCSPLSPGAGYRPCEEWRRPVAADAEKGERKERMPTSAWSLPWSSGAWHDSDLQPDTSIAIGERVAGRFWSPRASPALCPVCRWVQ